MFLDKYLNSTYLDLVYSNYNEDYLSILDEENFNNIYMLLKNKGFYFIEDIILNYLELFEIESSYVEHALSEIKSLIGEDYIKQIGKNMNLIDKIVSLACAFSDKDYKD